VDVYNPKVVQAAMGSHLRVHFFETDLEKHLTQINMPVLAAVLNGKNVYHMERLSQAALLIGNEGNGLHKNLIEKATHPITIPAKGGAESLNAAMATGILCALLTPQ
jgi:TrmH family RNA methyltransferase